MGDDDVARHAVLSGGPGSCIMTVATVVSGECIVSGIPHTTKHRLSGSVSLHCPKYLCMAGLTGVNYHSKVASKS